jgi:inorganic triphosphatase YgiF
LKSSGREVEIKFLLTKAVFKEAQQWELLGSNLPRPRARRLRSVYFDTEGGALQRHKAVLRVRSVNRKHLLTFKWNGTFSGGAFERGEVEVLSPTEEPDTMLLGEEIAALIEELCNGQALQPMYETNVKRVTYLVHTIASDVEVAFDLGFISGGQRMFPICEIEMELKSGHQADLYQLGLSLTETFPVTIGSQSKAERGALLRAGIPPAIVHPQKITANDPTVDDAIGLSLSNCVGHFLGNWSAFQTGDRIRAVHQMRVAMRRMRSIIAVFHRSFPCTEFVLFRQQAKDAAAKLGEARNWDVFIDLIREGPLAAFPNEAGFSILFRDAENHRDAGYEAASAMITATETSRFVLSLQSFIARHGWRNGLSAEILPRLTAPAEDFFIANLGRLYRKIVKAGKNFDELAAYDRHNLRKDLKKLRYLIELFSDMLDLNDKNKSYIRVVSKLQDQLGIFNDLVVAEEMMAKLKNSDEKAAIRAAGIVLGWCGHGINADKTALHRAWKKFSKMKFLTK